MPTKPAGVPMDELKKDPSFEAPLFVSLPSSTSLPVIKSTSTLTPLVCDERAIARLLAIMLQKGGISINEAAKRLGVTNNAVRQYIKGRRTKPSLQWFIRFAELTGAKVLIEFPK